MKFICPECENPVRWWQDSTCGFHAKCWDMPNGKAAEWLAKETEDVMKIMARERSKEEAAKENVRRESINLIKQALKEFEAEKPSRHPNVAPLSGCQYWDYKTGPHACTDDWCRMSPNDKSQWERYAQIFNVQNGLHNPNS